MNIDITRVWKDAEYRERLSAEELALLPQHPAGAIELREEDLDSVMGAWGGSNSCCQNITVCIDTVLCSVIC